MKRMTLLTLLLLGMSHSPVLAQDCQIENSIPSNLKIVGLGSATAETEGATSVKGGQGVYVKIKNVNVLGVSYNLTIEQDTTPPIPICTFKALLLPQKTVILSGALFGNPPIGWKISVAVGEESDAGVLTYDVYSQAGAAAKKKRSARLNQS
jgi:hypothetical protein